MTQRDRHQDFSKDDIDNHSQNCHTPTSRLALGTADVPLRLQCHFRNPCPPSRRERHPLAERALSRPRLQSEMRQMRRRDANPSAAARRKRPTAAPAPGPLVRRRRRSHVPVAKPRSQAHSACARLARRGPPERAHRRVVVIARPTGGEDPHPSFAPQGPVAAAPRSSPLGRRQPPLVWLLPARLGTIRLLRQGLATGADGA